MRHATQPVVVWRHPFEAAARPAPISWRGNFCFTFRDLIVLRMARALRAARLPPRRNDAIVARTAPPPPGVARAGTWPSTGA